MSQNVELAARPIELEFDQRPLYRRQISFGERPGEAFLLPVMTYHGHLSPPQLPTPILSHIGVEVVNCTRLSAGSVGRADPVEGSGVGPVGIGSGGRAHPSKCRHCSESAPADAEQVSSLR